MAEIIFLLLKMNCRALFSDNLGTSSSCATPRSFNVTDAFFHRVITPPTALAAPKAFGNVIGVPRRAPIRRCKGFFVAAKGDIILFNIIIVQAVRINLMKARFYFGSKVCFATRFVKKCYLLKQRSNRKPAAARIFLSNR
jgi:hypothetical protein